MSSNSVCNHTRNKQIGLPLRGRPILLSLVWLQTELDSSQSYSITKHIKPITRGCIKGTRDFLKNETWFERDKTGLYDSRHHLTQLQER